MVDRAAPDPKCFRATATLPYQLRLKDFELGMQDLYDLLWDMNSALLAKGLQRFEETIRPAIYSGVMSDVMTASLGRHARVLTQNLYHNGHPDLIPEGQYVDNAVKAGHDGVEIKVTKGSGGVDTHGARDQWLCLFRYSVDSTTQPAINRRATRITEILLARLTLDDFRRNDRGELGTRTASPNATGLQKLRNNRIYSELTP